LIHDPLAVPRAPNMADNRSPYNDRNGGNFWAESR
jgi:hypothetical protein